MSDWKVEPEDDRWIGAASTVMWTLYQSAVMEWELTQQLSIYRSVYVLPLTYGNKLWVVIEKNEIVDISRNELPAKRVWALP